VGLSKVAATNPDPVGASIKGHSKVLSPEASGKEVYNLTSISPHTTPAKRANPSVMPRKKRPIPRAARKKDLYFITTRRIKTYYHEIHEGEQKANSKKLKAKSGISLQGSKPFTTKSTTLGPQARELRRLMAPKQPVIERSSARYSR
jgi:hypothetical protein